MSHAVVYTRSSLGIKAPLVSVETHISFGLPYFGIVGLPETAVKESRDRVRSALINAHFEFPSRRIIVNLAPADLPKQGSRYDLPIALSILGATGQLPKESLENMEFVGELALCGSLRGIRGILPFALETYKNNKQLMLPADNAVEAKKIEKLTVFPAQHLLEVCAHLTNKTLISSLAKSDMADEVSVSSTDLSEVKGQQQAKRALEIAAAGGHNILFFGPPGTGKSLLAHRLTGILPSLSEQEAIEVAAIYSISEQGFSDQQWKRRPFRAPHHSASSVALVGGGSTPKPGEISLAHHGVLFLDELPEFNRKVLETLREPLESGKITISRAARQAEFPASFQLVAAMNPCPCGYYGDPQGRCHCSIEQVQRYRQRLSGPLLDRIDLQVEVPTLNQALLMETQLEEETSEIVKNRTMKARCIQWQRNKTCNARLTGKTLEKYCHLDHHNKQLMSESMTKLNLSARSFHRVLRVARTIADLEDAKLLQRTHLLEALSYRHFDKKSTQL